MDTMLAVALIFIGVMAIVWLVRLVRYCKKLKRDDNFFNEEYDRHITNVSGTYNAKHRRMRGWE